MKGPKNSNKDLIVDNFNIIAPGYMKLTTQKLKTISDTFRFLIEDLNYFTPSDRSLVFNIQIEYTRYKTLDVLYEVRPFIREHNLNRENVKLKGTKKEMFIFRSYKENEICQESDLQKQLRWVLNYYGLSLMYAEHYKTIDVKINDKQVDVTYS